MEKIQGKKGFESKRISMLGPREVWTVYWTPKWRSWSRSWYTIWGSEILSCALVRSDLVSLAWRCNGKGWRERRPPMSVHKRKYAEEDDCRKESRAPPPCRACQKKAQESSISIREKWRWENSVPNTRAGEGYRQGGDWQLLRYKANKMEQRHLVPGKSEQSGGQSGSEGWSQ